MTWIYKYFVFSLHCFLPLHDQGDASVILLAVLHSLLLLIGCIAEGYVYAEMRALHSVAQTLDSRDIPTGTRARTHHRSSPVCPTTHPVFGFGFFFSIFTKVWGASACLGFVSVWEVLDCLLDQELGALKPIHFYAAYISQMSLDLVFLNIIKIQKWKDIHSLNSRHKMWNVSEDILSSSYAWLSRFLTVKFFRY